MVLANPTYIRTHCSPAYTKLSAQPPGTPLGLSAAPHHYPPAGTSHTCERKCMSMWVCGCVGEKIGCWYD